MFRFTLNYALMAMGFFSFLFGSCSRPRAVVPAPEITADNEEGGFIDLGFSIRSHEKLPDGSEALHAYGMHHSHEVGITVIVGNEWKPGAPMGSMETFQGKVTYRSLGAPSDTLLQILDQLYGTGLQPKKMRHETVFVGISLEGEPADLDRGPAKIKLFYEPDQEDRYVELYTNIDLAKGILQIHEKDPDYRKAVIKALRSD
jgi:hypothetical protein